MDDIKKLREEINDELKKENNDYVLGYRNLEAWEEYVKRKIDILETQLIQSRKRIKEWEKWCAFVKRYMGEEEFNKMQTSNK